MKSSFKEIPNLTEDWNFWFTHINDLPKDITKRKKKKESFYFILNCETNEIDYVSPTIYDLLGYNASDFNIEKLFMIIHPDDREYCRKCEFDVIQVTNNLSHNEHFRYEFQYSYRIKNNDGNYITIRQQYQSIEVDSYGHMAKTLVLHEKIEDYKERSGDDFKIFDKLKNRPINFNTTYKLTKRELEILDLVHQGYKSDEISEMLFLSKFTVNTHRKNILSKTKSNSFIDLMKKI